MSDGGGERGLTVLLLSEKEMNAILISISELSAHTRAMVRGSMEA